MKLEHWTLDRFKPYERNPRQNDAVVDKMIASIAEFGFRMPVVVQSDGTVVDGHLRLKAAIQMELAQVPVVLADELTSEQVKAFRLLANRSANWADWDADLLSQELEELDMAGFDLELTGFSDLEIDNLLGEEVPDKPQTDYQPAQIFRGGGDYGPGDDEEEEDEAGPVPSIGGSYPLAIVLGFNDFQRWKAYKEGIGIKRDLQAFLQLLDEVNP
jgi:hypothetical protein